MSKAIGQRALMGLVDSEDEGDSDILMRTATVSKPKKDSMAPAKKGRGRAPVATNRVTKPTQTTTRRTSGRVAAATKTAGRSALAEKPTNVQQKSTRGKGANPVAVEDEPMMDAPKAITSPGEPSKAKGRGRPRGGKPIVPDEVNSSIAEEQSAPPVKVPAKRGRKPKAQVATPPAEDEIPETQQQEPVIPETQDQDLMEVDIEEHDQVEDLPAYTRVNVGSIQRSNYGSVQRNQPSVLYSASRRPIAPLNLSHDDPSIRRRLGDITRKCENLEMKYRDLRDIGIKEAERNFDRLKKQGEERTNTANQLIATLKAQLATQTELAKEGQRLKKQLEASEAKTGSLQATVDELRNTLSESKTEVKTLSTKLAAVRTAEAANVKAPGSAMKGNASNSRLLANAESAVQTAQMKEDLYADLTGLIVRGVKHENGEDVYDCIQTGRNGTLHFKLAIGVDRTSDAYDEAHFLYLPQLDSSRDRELMDVLPDYLVEEITFPRPHAAKFYARVMKALTEKLE